MLYSQFENVFLHIFRFPLVLVLLHHHLLGLCVCVCVCYYFYYFSVWFIHCCVLNSNLRWFFFFSFSVSLLGKYRRLFFHFRRWWWAVAVSFNVAYLVSGDGNMQQLKATRNVRVEYFTVNTATFSNKRRVNTVSLSIETDRFWSEMQQSKRRMMMESS